MAITRDIALKAAIGAFIIKFSQLEYALASLSAWTEFDVREYDSHYLRHVGLGTDKKRESLKDFIKSQLPEFLETWGKLNQEIGSLNMERRYIGHGFREYFNANQRVYAHVKLSGKLDTKELDVDVINSLTKRLSHLLTGQNGLDGNFAVLFTTARLNKWNLLVSDENKIVYEVNGKAVTKWKGKKET
jgi:hypothetical protein